MSELEDKTWRIYRYKNGKRRAVDVILLSEHERIISESAEDVKKARKILREAIEAKAMVMRLFSNDCLGLDDKYDHHDLDVFIEAQALLVEWGMIKNKDCRRW